MNDSSELLRVKSIRVEGLFDLFNHTVDLKLDERVTVLHGPNGVGKTMLLRLTNALLDGRLSLFQRVPFRRFVLVLSDNRAVSVTLGPPKVKLEKSPRNSRKRQNHPPPVLHLELLQGSNPVDRMEISGAQDVVAMAEAISLRMPWVHRYDEDLWYDERVYRDLLTPEEVVARYADELPPSARRSAERSDPDWLKAVRDQVNVHFIAAQRLLRVNMEDPRRPGSRPRTLSTVLDYASDLRSKISETMAGYGQKSQTLDQSFPQRLLASRGDALPPDALKARMETLDKHRNELKTLGLLVRLDSHPFDTAAIDRLDSGQQSVMTLYVKDTEQKLSELDDLARRARLLLDNVNSKFHHKQVRIDHELGLMAESENGRPLGLDALSSGEQHELVLHYDLLFRVRPNTLVLIDEPELSLHVAWQKRFLPDLLEIVETAHFDVLMATHSPFIVGDRTDLMIGLDAD